MKIEIYKRKFFRDYAWRLIASNGRKLCGAVGFNTKQALYKNLILIHKGFTLGNIDGNRKWLTPIIDITSSKEIQSTSLRILMADMKEKRE